MVLSFSDPARPPGDSDTTRVLRLPPGDNDLAKLCEADRIAEDVIAGRVGLAEGYAALRALDRPPLLRETIMLALARSEEHTSELQSPMSSPYAGFFWKKT